MWYFIPSRYRFEPAGNLQNKCTDLPFPSEPDALIVVSIQIWQPPFRRFIGIQTRLGQYLLQVVHHRLLPPHRSQVVFTSSFLFVVGGEGRGEGGWLGAYMTAEKVQTSKGIKWKSHPIALPCGNRCEHLARILTDLQLYVACARAHTHAQPCAHTHIHTGSRWTLAFTTHFFFSFAVYIHSSHIRGASILYRCPPGPGTHQWIEQTAVLELAVSWRPPTRDNT